jgi:hypothetical protein
LRLERFLENPDEELEALNTEEDLSRGRFTVDNLDEAFIEGSPEEEKDPAQSAVQPPGPFKKILFNGDFVDKGPSSLEVVLTVLMYSTMHKFT